MKAKRKAKATTKAKRGPGRLSRLALNNELIELTARLDKQYWLAEAMVRVNLPNDQHTMIEHQHRTVFGVQLDALLCGLRDVRGFAKTVRDAATRESA